MNRIIKFRAWDKKENKIVNLEEMHYYPDGRLAMVTLARTIDNTNIYERDRHPDDLEFLQYTGLKDKNNKEIYEGDIVEYFDSTNMWLNGEVIFEYGSFRIKTVENPILFYDGDCELIGNIYENPELIENKIAA